MTTAEGLFDIDWEGAESSRVEWQPVLALGGLLVLGGLFAYDYALLGNEPVVFGYDVGRVEWLWVACLWIDTVYVALPAVRDRDRTLAFLRRLLASPPAFAAALFVAAVLLAGTVGPLVLSQPSPSFEFSDQPPLFTSVPMDNVVSCHNPVGDRCYGSLRYPLGTNVAGKGMLRMVVLGSRVVVELAVVSVTLIVPLAMVAGSVAAYAGGRVDRAITTVAETVKTVPALLVFLMWRWIFFDGSVFALVLAFGLVNWGNVAIVVRSRALNEVSKNYVTAAEAAGASSLDVVREHLVPNVSRTAVSAAVYQVPLFVTIEATLSFLEFGDPPSFLLTTLPTQESWGRMIGRSVEQVDPYWWRAAVPIAALLLTIFTMNVFADYLAELLDPHGRE